MAHSTFNMTTGGLRRDTPPMLLFERAKRFGIWNPSDIDFSQDKKDWEAMSESQRDLLLRVIAMFAAGEEAVTMDLLPLINVIANEGRIEEEMYLTTFLFEEAKHVDFFSRFLREVCGDPQDLTQYASPNYTRIVYDALPEALNALRDDHSARALTRASAVYNMIVEGMLAETGYHGFFTIMDRHNILPGQRAGLQKLKLDESRHIAYGVYLLSRLMSEEPGVWVVVEETMNALMMPGLGVVSDIFGVYDPIPFNVTQEEFTAYAASQFQKRLERVRRARNMTLEEVNEETAAIIDANDG